MFDVKKYGELMRRASDLATKNRQPVPEATIKQAVRDAGGIPGEVETTKTACWFDGLGNKLRRRSFRLLPIHNSDEDLWTEQPPVEYAHLGTVRTEMEE